MDDPAESEYPTWDDVVSLVTSRGLTHEAYLDSQGQTVRTFRNLSTGQEYKISYYTAVDNEVRWSVLRGLEKDFGLGSLG
jgi:hypothetical protein